MAIVSSIVLILSLTLAAIMFKRLIRTTEIAQSKAEIEGYSEKASSLAAQKNFFLILWIIFMALSALTVGVSFYSAFSSASIN